MRGPFARSLSLRLLGIFAVTAFLLVAIVVTLFVHALGSQWQRSIAPHLARYVLYIDEHLGDPPDPARADRIASNLPMTIVIYRDGRFVHSTDGRRPDFSSLRFRPLPARSRRFLAAARSARAEPPPARSRPRDALVTRSPTPVAIAREHAREGAVLRVRRGGHTVYLQLEARQGRPLRHGHGLDVALAAVALVLLASFLLIRRQLAPIRRIQTGVRRMSAGELDHRIGVAGHDDLAELGRSVDEMAARIDAMLEAKRQLLLAVSHELRSPLTRARVSSGLLPESRERARIEADLDEMARLIEDLIESERLRTPHVALLLERLDLAALVDGELAPRDLASRVIDARAADATDAESHDRDAAVPIVGDAARLRVLVRNLVGNALTHGRASDGRAEVEVTLTRGDGTVRLDVVDHGPGIAPEHLEAVTEAFFRPDAARTRASGGVGLGLSLARLVAEAHGGTLDIASDPARGPGTRVTVVLPAGGPPGTDGADSRA